MGDRRVSLPAGPWLALDTATTRAVVAIGRPDELPVASSWQAGRQHGETLLPAIDRLLRQVGVARGDLAAVIIGTGPGAFTGLRVGLATAKTMAHELGCPIVGLPTAVALAAAVGGRVASGSVAIVQPAGPHDRYVTTVRLGPVPTAETPRLVVSGEPLAVGEHSPIVAVDLAASAPGITPAMVELGRDALAGLGLALLSVGGAILAAGHRDDVAALVPLYVSLPRGVPEAVGALAWSPDLP